MNNNVVLKLPNSNDTISVTKDMEEYYLKMGYTKTENEVKSNVVKLKPKKEEDK